MIEYRLSNSIVHIPQKEEELSIGTFMNIKKFFYKKEILVEEEYENSYEYLKICINNPLDDISFSEYNEMTEILNGVDIFKIDKITNNNVYWCINDIDYACEDMFDRCSFREMFYINQIRTVGMNEWEYIPLTLAALVRPAYKVEAPKEFPDKTRWGLEKLDVEFIHSRKDRFMKQKVGDLYYVINKFHDWENSIRKRFAYLYESEPQDNKGEFLKPIQIHAKWTYIAMLDALCGKDVTKIDQVMDMNYIEVLTMLSGRQVQDEYWRKINASKVK